MKIRILLLLGAVAIASPTRADPIFTPLISTLFLAGETGLSAGAVAGASSILTGIVTTSSGAGVTIRAPRR